MEVTPELSLSLLSLRPRQPTDLVRLSTLLRLQNAGEAALPAALPERLLLAIARDLRSMDADESEDAKVQPTIAAPLMLVICLLMGGAQPGGDQMTISEEALHSSLRIYQWAVEREIVTRITGIGGEQDQETLLSKFGELRKNVEC